MDKVILATRGDDTIFGGPDSDGLYDYEGTNSVYGELGNDYIVGLGRLYGGHGDDEVVAWRSDEATATATVRVTGGPGNDLIRTHDGTDRGPEIVYARDGERDEIDCGPGEDTVYYDEGLDAVDQASCEKLNPPQ